MQPLLRAPAETGLERRGRARPHQNGWAALGIGIAALALAGCVQSLPQAGLPSDVKALVVDGDRKPPRAAAVALSSVEGAPEPMMARFKATMASDAAQREITITDPGSARYFVRGYLDAYTAEGGVAVRSVWDIYDSSKRLSHRVETGLVVPGNAADPWSLVDEGVLEHLAARSAGEMADVLAGTPDENGAKTASAPVD